MVVVNAVFPSFLNLTESERSEALQRKTIAMKALGLLLTLSSICIWLASVSSEAEAAALAAAQTPVEPPAWEILLVSDWGCTPVSVKSCDSQRPQRAVATAMNEYALQSPNRAARGSFSYIINMGDSFYDQGLQSTADVTKAIRSHKSVYGGLPGLAVPWRSVMGNHDYRGDASLVIGRHVGQLSYPARYYDWYEDLGCVFVSAQIIEFHGCSVIMQRPHVVVSNLRVPCFLTSYVADGERIFT